MSRRARPRHDQRQLGSLSGRWIVRIVIGFDCRDAILFLCPRAKIDHLAAFRAKRAIRIIRRPGDLDTALRTRNQASFRHYRLQKVRSNSTSDSQVRGRPSSPGVVKRMFKAYLLALISGMQLAARGTRMRTICASLPPSIC